MDKFEKVGFIPADILIPKDIEMEKWSVVACDQYTSQAEYWTETEKIVGSSPSSLNIVFPEIYLENDDYNERINRINENMNTYLNDGIFDNLESSFVYVERRLLNGKVRRGIVGAVDLEAYDYSNDADSLVRATEKTVIERIPPRIRIRINAPLELPHIMLLIDNADKSVIEPFSSQKESLKVVYDFDLMQGGGHITGYHLPLSKSASIADSLEALMKNSDLLFAVGDGNHSLATAKECWEITKKNLSADEIKMHPARYALAEVVNIHDESLEFEPIHRVVFGCDPQNVIDEFLQAYEGASLDSGKGQNIKFTYGGKQGELFIENPPYSLSLGTLQSFLDNYVKRHGCKIDYIHGGDVVETLSQKDGNMGFLLPAMEKSELFPSVIADGVLPRKTFSMGEANEKRFYLECRKI